MNCQKCRTPLKIDSSLQDLNPAAYDLLVGSSGRSIEQGATPSRPPYPRERKQLYDRAVQHADVPTFRRSIPAPRRGIGPLVSTTGGARATLRDNSAMSFVLLSESQLGPHPHIQNGTTDERISPHAPRANGRLSSEPHQALSQKIDKSTRLFEILSARSDIDHPICQECTELLLESLQVRLVSSTKERDAYISFLRELKNNIPSAAEVAEAEADLIATKAAEEKAFAELVALEAEKASLEDELVDLEEESRALDQEEDEFWRSRNAFALTLSSFQEARDALNTSYEHDAQQLERLQRTNVYNDTFCIGHDGDFGTINGLRLGRLPPPKNVEWPEINAAWGMTALLLATVAEKLGFFFRGYRIKPMGSTTHIERLEASQLPSFTNSVSSPTGPGSNSPRPQPVPPKVTSLELFSSGDLPLGRTFLHRRFNEAMIAFLACLKQLGEFVENGGRNYVGHQNQYAPSRGLKLPYKIEKDKISEISIKLGTSQDEQWTNACKYVLTCCKFLLAHASNVASAEAGGRRESGS